MKTKRHTLYKTKEGKRLQGATTIIDQQLGWNKGQLMGWTRKMALSGTDPNLYKQEMADIGTLGHELIMDYILHEKTGDTSDYSANQIKKANNCLNSFKAWGKDNDIEAILLETPMVSEKLLFGGTPDIYCLLDGVFTLIDIKTGGLWLEHYIQVGGAYDILLEERGEEVEDIILLNVPRAEGTKFTPHKITNQQRKICRSIFELCLKQKNLKRELEESCL